jgi:hypothetical protein
MDETTTDAATQDTGVEDYSTQPEEQPAEAVYTPGEPITTDSEEEPEAPAPDNSTDDFDYESWLAKKQIDPSTPEGKAQIAKSWRELEKKMHATTQQASELEKQVNSQPLADATTDPAVQEALTRAARVETTLAVERWKSQNGITAEQDTALGQYLVENPQKAWLVKNGHLSYDDVYAMSGVGKTDPAALKQAGGKEALQALANKQRATSPTGNATSSAPPAGLTKENADSWWDSLGYEGRQNPENRRKLDQILST